MARRLGSGQGTPRSIRCKWGNEWEYVEVGKLLMEEDLRLGSYVDCALVNKYSNIALQSRLLLYAFVIIVFGRRGS
jgi:hypothetical protein